MEAMVQWLHYSPEILNLHVQNQSNIEFTKALVIIWVGRLGRLGGKLILLGGECLIYILSVVRFGSNIMRIFNTKWPHLSCKFCRLEFDRNSFFKTRKSGFNSMQYNFPEVIVIFYINNSFTFCIEN